MRQRIKQLLEEDILYVDFDGDFLFAEMDSFGVTTVLMILSEEFGIELSAADATPRNLKSLDSIVALVEAKQAEKK